MAAARRSQTAEADHTQPPRALWPSRPCTFLADRPASRDQAQFPRRPPVQLTAPLLHGSCTGENGRTPPSGPAWTAWRGSTQSGVAITASSPHHRLPAIDVNLPQGGESAGGHRAGQDLGTTGVPEFVNGVLVKAGAARAAPDDKQPQIRADGLWSSSTEIRLLLLRRPPARLDGGPWPLSIDDELRRRRQQRTAVSTVTLVGRPFTAGDPFHSTPRLARLLASRPDSDGAPRHLALTLRECDASGEVGLRG